MFLRNSLIYIFFVLLSCQPVELIDPVKIDNSRLSKISISAKELLVQVNYNPIFSEENIEDKIKNTPLTIIENWINNNIINFGNENKLIINILEASITKKEVENTNANKYEEKTIFNYKIFFLVEYNLFDDSNFLIANTTVETLRSTTSKKYISLNEEEMIINDLLNKAIYDFVNETKSMTQLYMAEYLL